MALYQHVSPNMSYVSFAEEMLPFLDVLPSATTGWLMEFGPELWEDAKAIMKDPGQVVSASGMTLQTILWGNTSNSHSNRNRSSNTQGSAAGSHSSASSRRLPNGRPSRHA